ncbi:CE1 family esterase [Frankia nepalensis]|uniref:Poly(3-hydroxybutyrate) depolymerase n=1 Tax=Frankia nepalensis TaxID=1836974 RepID=A0A937RQT1_9ACTN|nr:PHB depolymerase family esterase [Frankia nepalensis]MBL7500212.1 hypothetical protein [Frankia nepalensis]MBL7514613.1 hypothetical protein [Frankia nepalensis]MBL7631674.1 hypothetical protein [Frankia nepalensis]
MDGAAPGVVPTGTGACEPGRSAPAGAERLTFEFGGLDRDYELSVPPEYDGTRPAPLVLSLHGFTSSIEQQDQASDLPRAAGERGYVVVTPLGEEISAEVGGSVLTGPFFNVTPWLGTQQEPGFAVQDDLGFVTSLLDHVKTRLCIDAAREYVTGISNGAGLTMALVCERDELFAAAAPVAGITMNVVCPAKRATPLVALHGTADSAVPYGGGNLLGLPISIPPVEKRVTDHATLGGCDPEPAQDRPGADIRHSVWKCPPGQAVELYTVEGGGHTWFGASTRHGGQPMAGDTSSIDATEVMLDFFDEHRLS